MNDLFNAETIAATLRMTTPLILVALGGLMCQRAAIFNIGLEGYMLMGAFCSILFINISGSSLAGLIGGILGSVLLSLVYALFVIKFKANHILTSISVNYVATGLTSFLLMPLFGVKGSFRPTNMQALPTVNIPFLEEGSFLDIAFNNHTVTVYVALALIAVVYVLLFQTPFGLRVRSVGGNENAVRTAGVRPETIKLLVIIWAGVLCGVAGAHLSTGYASEFTESITQGRGFTAFSAIVFGGAHPVFSSLACLLFGLADAVGIRLELANMGVPAGVIKMFPYALACIAVAVSSLVQLKKRTSSKELF